MAGTVPVWTVQALAAHAAAKTMGAYRASPQHLENGDFCNPESYEFMVTELEKRVGPCPKEVQESWIERGGAGTSKPVWVWVQPPYVPAAAQCGQRNILVEAEVRREDVLRSQIQAYHHVLNDFPLAVTEAEDEEFDALKTSEPETWRQRKIDSWQRVFEVDWQGESYSLQPADTATLQGVLWQLPLSCVRRTRHMLELGRSRGDQAVEVDYPADGLSVGEDVELTAAWIARKATLPPLHLHLAVSACAAGGAADTAGVRSGWTVTCLLSPAEDEEPLPSLPLQRGVSTGVGNRVRPKRAPPPAAELLAALRKLRGVQLVFQAPEEEPDSDDELYDETQEIPESSHSESDSDAAT